MDDLIKALTILRKYGNPAYPTHCEHDVMYICGIDPEDVPHSEIEELNQLGFFVGNEDAFQSYKFGSA